MTATLSPEKYDEVTEALKDVMDPELGVNVVDLGLVYDLKVDDDAAVTPRGNADDGAVYAVADLREDGELVDPQRLGQFGGLQWTRHRERDHPDEQRRTIEAEFGCRRAHGACVLAADSTTALRVGGADE